MSPRRVWDGPQPKLGRQSPKKQARVQADALTRTDVWRRQKGLCACCGSPLGSSWAAHHRKRLSQGGQDSICNLVGLKHGCHRSVHDHPQRSYDHGYLVRRHEDPALVPLHRFDGAVVFLALNGTYVDIREVA